MRGTSSALYMRATPADRAVIMCERLRTKVSDLKLSHRGMPVAVTCSFGIADIATCGEAQVVSGAQEALKSERPVPRRVAA